MKVLLTGAFGNVGGYVLEELLKRGHQVRCFDVKTRVNRQKARRIGGAAEIVWGDLRNPDDVATAVNGQDTVVHLAFVIPTLSATGVSSEDDPAWARSINVGGTQNLLAAMQAQPAPLRVLFTSSLHIYGRTHDQPPPRTVDDPPQPIEHYAHHKVECEALVKSSGLPWAIFRLGAALPVRLVLDPGMFGVPLDNRIEYVHPRDVAMAIANGLEDERVWGKTWLVGGGPACQLYQRELVERVLGATGIGMLPEEAFTTIPFPTDWLDTAESQRVLQFQQHTLQDYAGELRALLGFKRFGIRLFRPLIRKWLLQQSPWIGTARRANGMGKVAVVTGASSGIGAATARQLAGSGYTVILVARRSDPLQDLVAEIETGGGQASFVTADLADEDERRRVFDQISATYGAVDVLVNSAGIGWYGYGEEMPWPLARQMMEVNMTAVTRLTLLFLSEMKRRNRGHIINVSSIAGSLPSQGVALYSATKSFVDTLTSSLYRELQGTNVRVSVVKPGAVATPFFTTAAAGPRGRPIPVEKLAIKADTVARRIIKVIRKPKRVVYVPSALGIIPWVEVAFGWLLDRLGPLLLRRELREG